MSKSEGKWPHTCFLNCYVFILFYWTGLSGYVVEEIIVINDKIPPEGYSLISRTIDSEQKAWRKKQLCYKLVPRKSARLVVTDIIVCSRLKKAPEGFNFAG